VRVNDNDNDGNNEGGGVVVLMRWCFGGDAVVFWW